MRLELLGPPGAGKGTQAIKIIERFNIPHIATGDILRRNIKEGTEFGIKAREYMKKGDLVPDDLIIDIVVDRLRNEDCKDGFLLDGFPRTVYQAEKLDQFLCECNCEIDRVLDLVVEKEVLMNRLASRRVCRECGATYNLQNIPPIEEGICDSCKGELYQREDDSVDIVENRIEIYRTQTNPLISYYEKRGNIVHLKGEADPEQLFREIEKLL